MSRVEVCVVVKLLFWVHFTIHDSIHRGAGPERGFIQEEIQEGQIAYYTYCSAYLRCKSIIIHNVYSLLQLQHQTLSKPDQEREDDDKV